MDITKHKKDLLLMLHDKSFRYSKEPIYKLVSGRMSNFYIDSKLTTLDAKGAYLTGLIIFEMIKELNPDGIGGLTLGADPIATSVAVVSFINNQPISSFIVRKEPKKHGSQQWIEGQIKPNGRVVVVDDVITTGSSTIKAINIMKENGYNIIKVIGLLDRQEGGKEAIKNTGFDLESVFTIEDIMKIKKD